MASGGVPAAKKGADRTVYFDFLSFFMVTYSHSMGNVLAKLVVLVSLLSMALRMRAQSCESSIVVDVTKSPHSKRRKGTTHVVLA